MIGKRAWNNKLQPPLDNFNNTRASLVANVQRRHDMLALSSLPTNSISLTSYNSNKRLDLTAKPTSSSVFVAKVYAWTQILSCNIIGQTRNYVAYIFDGKQFDRLSSMHFIVLLIIMKLIVPSECIKATNSDTKLWTMRRRRAAKKQNLLQMYFDGEWSEFVSRHLLPLRDLANVT